MRPFVRPPIPGVALVRSGVFGESAVLTETFAAWGVHFLGPATGDGGFILNGTGGQFTAQPASGDNFLAFNPPVVPAAKAPGTIRFDAACGQVSIEAAGANNSDSFRLQAVVAVVATASVTTRVFAILTVTAADIRKVVVTNTAVSPDSYVFDDLTYSTTPEPAATVIASAFVATRLLRRRYKPSLTL